MENEQNKREESPIKGNPDSTEGKVSYGGTSEDEQQQSKENEGFPAGSWGESSMGGEENILSEDEPEE